MTNEDSIAGPQDPPGGHDGFLSWVRQVKTRIVGTHPEDHDLSPAVRMVWSKPFLGEFVALAPAVNRDAGLFSAEVMGHSVWADSITMVSDTLSLVPGGSPICPATGELWASGDLQRHWAAGNADALVTEALTASTVWRTGRIRIDLSPYTVTDGVLAWGRAEHIDTGTDEPESAGHVTDALHAAITCDCYKRGLLATAGELMGLDAEHVAVHSIAAAADVLKMRGFTCLVGGANPLLLARLEQSGEAIDTTSPLMQTMGLDPTLAEIAGL